MSIQTSQSSQSFSKRLVVKIALGLLRLLSWLPLSVAQAFGKVTGRLFFATKNRNKFLVECNLKAVYPQLSATQREFLVKKTLQNNAQSLFELGAIWYWNRQKMTGLIREEVNRELLDAAHAKGNGVLVLGPHIGNWELMGSYLSILYPSTFMYRPPRQASLEAPMKASRMRFGANLVPTDLRGIKQIIKALKENQLTAILPDQDAGENGVHAPFMGHPARTMTLVSKLLQKTEAQCLYAIALRHPQGGFVVHYLPADREALASKDVLVATTALNQGVEACVALAPEQYLWAYHRFRGQPQGAPNLYAKD